METKGVFIVLVIIAAILVIGALINLVAGIASKRNHKKAEEDLLEAIQKRKSVNIEVIEKLSIATIESYRELIVDNSTEVLERFFLAYKFCPDKILEVISLNLEEVNSLINEEKKQLFYDLFLGSCRIFSLTDWFPVIVEFAIKLNEEDATDNTNNVYNFMVDILKTHKEFSESEFSEEYFVRKAMTLIEEGGWQIIDAELIKKSLEDIISTAKEELNNEKIM